MHDLAELAASKTEFVVKFKCLFMSAKTAESIVVASANSVVLHVLLRAHAHARG